MACSNFCSSNNFDHIKTSMGYVSRSAEAVEYHSMQKGHKIYQAMVSASTSDAGIPLEEASMRFGGDWTIVGTLGLAIVGLGIITALGDAISTMLGGKRASEM
jgi:hypothetical protein